MASKATRWAGGVPCGEGSESGPWPTKFTYQLGIQELMLFPENWWDTKVIWEAWVSVAMLHQKLLLISCALGWNNHSADSGTWEPCYLRILMKADDIFEHSDGVQTWYGKVDA